ncbi:MAG: sigma-54 dependent transcriptional regulator [Acidobacteriia bacterium]|nr:sigma-54 dependent transcriptional regulator [Terriglobia bacterium]
MRREDASILVVDDEFSVRDSLCGWFRKDGFKVETAENATEALRKLQEGSWDIVLLDIKMPGMDGLELQQRIHEIDPDVITVMITAYASVESAVQALKQGAFDYITKPIDPDELSHLVRKALDQRHLKTENVQLRQKIDQLSQFGEIVGDSSQMQKVLELVRSVAETDATVLIRGESGTGKELIAQAIHANSHRRYFPIVPVNCGALSESLLESELFGHEKGAFTGAVYRRKGKLEMSNGGTLFLDEVGSISLKTQVELLRVLETKEFTRLGGTKPTRVDFRVICATNQNLEKTVEEGQFREDLYYRLNVFSIYLPPLRERRQDIPQLAQHFLRKYALQMNKNFTEINPEAMDMLVRHEWPGNIRELANAVERALVVGRPPSVRPGDLPLQISSRSDSIPTDSLAAMEKAHIQRILERTGWNITRAAETLKIDRVTLYNKIKKYDLRK